MPARGRIGAGEARIVHAFTGPAQAAIHATAPHPAASAAAGAVADPTHVLGTLDLADLERLIAGPAAPQPAPPAAAAASPSPRRHDPWGWLWATYESAASLYVALTEPERRRPRTSAG